MRSTDGAFALLFTLDLNIPFAAVPFSLYFLVSAENFRASLKNLEQKDGERNIHTGTYGNSSDRRDQRTALPGCRC